MCTAGRPTYLNQLPIGILHTDLNVNLDKFVSVFLLGNTILVPPGKNLSLPLIPLLPSPKLISILLFRVYPLSLCLYSLDFILS